MRKVGGRKVQLDYERSCKINMESVSTVLYTTINSNGEGGEIQGQSGCETRNCPKKKKIGEREGRWSMAFVARF